MKVYRIPNRTVPFRTRRWLIQGTILGVGAALGLLLGWLAIRGAQWDLVKQSLRGFPPSYLLVAIALFLASAYMRAFRWRLLWISERVSTLRLLWIETAAIGVNNVMPLRAFDEPIIFGILVLRDKLPASSVIVTMLICRILDLLFTILFILLAVILFPVLIRFAPAVVLTSLFFVGWLVLLMTFSRIVRRFPFLLRIPGLANFEQGVNSLWARKVLMTLSFSLTATYWLLQGATGWIVALGLGIDLSLYQAVVVVFGVIFFATAVPSLPGAVGTFEFATVYLLQIWGVANTPAVTFSIVLHAILFLVPILIAILALPLEGIRSLKALRELLNNRRQARAAEEPQSTSGAH